MAIFKINLPLSPDTLVLKCKSMFSADTALILLNKSQYLYIILESHAYELSNIDVEAPPVIIKGDTLVYKVASYVRGSDRSVEDVIKRIPGFEVDDGTGKYITMGGQYRSTISRVWTCWAAGIALPIRTCPTALLQVLKCCKIISPLKCLTLWNLPTGHRSI